MREYNHEFADHWFYTPSLLERASGLSLVRAGRNIAKPNYYMGPRFITYYSFHFIRSGNLVFNQNEVLGPGDMFCLWPNITHQYGFLPDKVKSLNRNTSSSSEPPQMFWIALDGKQVPILSKMIGISQYNPILRNILNSNVDNVIHQICDLLKDMDQNNNTVRTDAKVLSLIYALFHEISIQVVEQPWDEDSDWLTRAEEYIQLHSMDGVTVHDVVRYVGLNRSHVSRTFAAKYGLSPGEYIQKIRLNRAATMLETPHHTVTEIALSVGYPDLYSFTRAFTRYFSVSPSRYRKNKQDT